MTAECAKIGCELLTHCFTLLSHPRRGIRFARRLRDRSACVAPLAVIALLSIGGIAQELQVCHSQLLEDRSEGGPCDDVRLKLLLRASIK